MIIITTYRLEPHEGGFLFSSQRRNECMPNMRGKAYSTRLPHTSNDNNGWNKATSADPQVKLCRL